MQRALRILLAAADEAALAVVFANLPLGTYDVSAELRGFEVETRSPLR